MKLSFAKYAIIPATLAFASTGIADDLEAKAPAKKESAKSAKTKPKPAKPAEDTPPKPKQACRVSEVLKWKPVEVYTNMQTGEIIGDATDANARAYFSSVTKIMPMYITLSMMRDGQIKPDERIKIAHRKYTSVFGSVNGKDAIPNNVTAATPNNILSAIGMRSSNDGPNALGIRISGTLEEFYALENSYARRLAMDGNWHSATGYNEAEAVKLHWQTPLAMAKLVTAAYKEFPDALIKHNGREATLYGYERGTEKEIAFKIKSKIQAKDPEYPHYIKELKFMKPGFTCSGGIAAAGVVNVEGMDFAFAYAGYRNYQQRDQNINQMVVQIRKDILEGKIKEYVPGSETDDPVGTAVPIENGGGDNDPSSPQMDEPSNVPPFTLGLGFALATMGAAGFALSNKKKSTAGNTNVSIKPNPAASGYSFDPSLITSGSSLSLKLY